MAASTIISYIDGVVVGGPATQSTCTVLTVRRFLLPRCLDRNAMLMPAWSAKMFRSFQSSFSVSYLKLSLSGSGHRQRRSSPSTQFRHWPCCHSSVLRPPLLRYSVGRLLAGGASLIACLLRPLPLCLRVSTRHGLGWDWLSCQPPAQATQVSATLPEMLALRLRSTSAWTMAVLPTHPGSQNFSRLRRGMPGASSSHARPTSLMTWQARYQTQVGKGYEICVPRGEI